MNPLDTGTCTDFTGYSANQKVGTRYPAVYPMQTTLGEK